MGKKLTQEEFVAKAIKVHGDKYDYSKTVYVRGKDKVIITCPTHGDFQQKAENHLAGEGCNKCGRDVYSKKRAGTTSKFIEDAKNTHGDLYDYSKSEYTTSHSKLIIICRKHGEFLQAPIMHTSGNGCPQCAIESKAKSRRSDTDCFITKATETHKGFYDYTYVAYTNNYTKVKIICPIHGEFWQTPNSHLLGKGCVKCSDIATGQRSRDTAESFISKAVEVHGEKYDYSKVEYKFSNIPVNIICKKHGVFRQKPNTHLSGGGCPKCHSSRGELFIEKYLRDNAIHYITQYRDHSCEVNRKLLFDFAVFSNVECTDIIALIEYDGEQHFTAIDHFGGGAKYEKTKKYDQVKNEYCLTNGIKLIRIPYYEMNSIDSILDKELQLEG